MKKTTSIAILLGVAVLTASCAKENTAKENTVARPKPKTSRARRSLGLTASVRIESPRCARRRAAMAVPIMLSSTKRLVVISSEKERERCST